MPVKRKQEGEKVRRVELSANLNAGRILLQRKTLIAKHCSKYIAQATAETVRLSKSSGIQTPIRE
ncbi:MAG: hypothetical protein ACJAVI_001598 [Candidatus Azotimanducaceae bacterium]|jgi:hypothetical protein